MKIIKKQEYPRIIAVRGSSFLVEQKRNYGVIVDKTFNTISQEMNIHSALKMGYWYPYKGTESAEELLER